jgi:hypothetical protein
MPVEIWLQVFTLFRCQKGRPKRKKEDIFMSSKAELFRWMLVLVLEAR